MRNSLLAFLEAYGDYLAEHLELVRLPETAAAGARYRIGSYRLWHRRLTLHCGAATDPEHLAHALLAAIEADLNSALRRRTYRWERLRAGDRDLAERALR